MLGGETEIARGQRAAPHQIQVGDAASGHGVSPAVIGLDDLVDRFEFLEQYGRLPVDGGSTCTVESISPLVIDATTTWAAPVAVSRSTARTRRSTGSPGEKSNTVRLSGSSRPRKANLVVVPTQAMPLEERAGGPYLLSRQPM